MRCRGESETSKSIELSFCGTEFEQRRQVELRCALEDLPRLLAGASIRVFVNVLPHRRRVRPHQHPEALNESISTGTAKICAPHVFADASRLCAAKDRKTNRLQRNVAARYSVEGIRLSPRPAR